MPDFACPRCKEELVEPFEISSKTDSPFTKIGGFFASGIDYTKVYPLQCHSCEFSFCVKSELSGYRFDYPVHELLILELKKYVKYSLGQNNGYVSYGLLEQASLSIVENKINSEFKNFVQELCISEHTVLDVGCGSQEIPIYLSGLPNYLVGLDPFDSKFCGTFIKGSAEYIPLRPASVGTVICATSIDHLFDIELALQEFRRVLISGGRVIIWDHAGHKRPFSLIHFLRLGFYAIRGKYKFNFPKKRYQIYDNGVVLPIPRGFADPFHAPMSRKKNWSEDLRKKFLSAGYREIRRMDDNGFSCWESK